MNTMNLIHEPKIRRYFYMRAFFIILLIILTCTSVFANDLISGTYDFGDDETINNDDKIVLEFNTNITNIGARDDYEIYYDLSGGGNYQMLTGSEFKVTTGPSTNFVCIAFTDVDENAFLNINNQILLEAFKVNIKSSSSILPQVTNEGTSINVPIDRKGHEMESLIFYLNTKKIPYSFVNGDGQYTFPVMYDDLNNINPSSDIRLTPTDPTLNPVSMPITLDNLQSNLTLSVDQGQTALSYEYAIVEAQSHIDSLTISYPSGLANEVLNLNDYVYGYYKELPAGTILKPTIATTSNLDVNQSTSGNFGPGSTYTITLKVTEGVSMPMTYAIYNFHFTVEETEMGIQSLSHNRLGTSTMKDDKTIITFTNDVIDEGSKADYSLKLIGSDNTELHDFQENDYNITDGPAANQVTINYTSNVSDILKNHYDTKLSLEILGLTNLDPHVASDQKSKETPIVDEFLYNIDVNGQSVANFSPDVFTYNIELPMGTIEHPTIDIPPLDNVQRQDTTVDDTFVTTLNVVDLDNNNALINTYTLNFTVSTDSIGITSIKYFPNVYKLVAGDDTIVATFSAPLTTPGAIENYILSVDYQGDGVYDKILNAASNRIVFDPAEPNKVTFEIYNDSDDSQTLTDLWANNHLMKFKIEVKEDSLTTIIPTVSSSARSAVTNIPGRNADLTTAKLIIPNTSIEIPIFNFETTRTDYTNIPVLPSIAQMTLMPSGTPKDPNALYNPQKVESGHLRIEMVSEDEFFFNEYNFYYIARPSLLRDIKIDGTSIENFYPNKYTYDIELAAGKTTDPIITAFFDNPKPNYVETEFSSTGTLGSGKTVTIKTLDTSTSEPKVKDTYILNFTVATDNSNTDTNTDTDTNTNESSESPSSNNNSPSDSDVTDQLTGNNGSLVDLKKPKAKDTPTAPEDKIKNITSILERIQTPAGAKTILEQMPKTLEELKAMRSALDGLDDTLKFDNNIVALMSETERLIGLLQQPKQARYMILEVIKPLGDYYKDIDPSALASKQLTNSAMKMANTAIAQAGRVQTSWKTIDIKKGGRIALTPTDREIQQAILNAKNTEKELESQMNQNLEQGLNNGIYSTLTVAIPDELKNAQSASAELSSKTLKTLKDNNIQKINLNLGPVSFQVDQKFVDAHQQAPLEFQVNRQKAISDEEKKHLPSGTRAIGAPVLELSALQNKKPGNAFNRPLDISFNLDAFELDVDSPIDYKNGLTIYRENPETGEWEPVGGVYDPITNTLSTRRKHLSKYTVLKTEKNYSNIEDSWAKNEISALKNKGVIDDEKLFVATDNVTREEFAGWISNAYGLDTEGLEANLSDLDPDSPYYDAIANAYEQGIIAGKSDGSFDPTGQVTKEEMAVMIAAAMTEYDNPVDTDTFELAQYEEDLPTWAVGSIETVVENGAVDEAFFGSADAVTKEEAANILYQVYR